MTDVILIFFVLSTLRHLIHFHSSSPGHRNAQRHCFASVTSYTFPLVILFCVFRSVFFLSLLSSPHSC